MHYLVVADHLRQVKDDLAPTCNKTRLQELMCQTRARLRRPAWSTDLKGTMSSDSAYLTIGIAETAEKREIPSLRHFLLDCSAQGSAKLRTAEGEGRTAFLSQCYGMALKI